MHANFQSAIQLTAATDANEMQEANTQQSGREMLLPLVSLLEATLTEGEPEQLSQTQEQDELTTGNDFDDRQTAR